MVRITGEFCSSKALKKYHTIPSVFYLFKISFIITIIKDVNVTSSYLLLNGHP